VTFKLLQLVLLHGASSKLVKRENVPLEKLYQRFQNNRTG